MTLRCLFWQPVSAIHHNYLAVAGEPPENSTWLKTAVCRTPVS